MITKEITYQDNTTNCVGYLAYDDSTKAKRPAVLIAPAFEGRSELYCQQAETLAKAGYVAMVADMYGDAKVAKSIDEARGLINPFFADRAMLQTRINAAFNTLKTIETVDTNNMNAIGFCFGGMCVLDLARSGANVKRVVGFHSVFAAPEGLPNKPIQAKILLLHGYDDPMAAPDQLKPFAKEMAGVDWQCLFYGNIMHAFTDPAATEVEIGRQYDAKTNERAWQQMQHFLNEK